MIVLRKLINRITIIINIILIKSKFLTIKDKIEEFRRTCLFGFCRNRIYRIRKDLGVIALICSIL